MATAKKWYGVLCQQPEDDDMEYIDMRTKFRAKLCWNHNRFYFVPQVVMNQKENSLSYNVRLHHQLQSKAAKKGLPQMGGKISRQNWWASWKCLSLNVSADDNIQYQNSSFFIENKKKSLINVEYGYSQERIWAPMPTTKGWWYGIHWHED